MRQQGGDIPAPNPQRAAYGAQIDSQLEQATAPKKPVGKWTDILQSAGEGLAYGKDVGNMRAQQQQMGQSRIEQLMQMRNQLDTQNRNAQADTHQQEMAPFQTREAAARASEAEINLDRAKNPPLAWHDIPKGGKAVIVGANGETIREINGNPDSGSMDEQFADQWMKDNPTTDGHPSTLTDYQASRDKAKEKEQLSEQEFADFGRMVRADPKLSAKYDPTNRMSMEQFKSDMGLNRQIVALNAGAGVQAAATKGGISALANVPPHLVASAQAAKEKATATYDGAQKAADDIKTMIDLAKSGNKLAQAYTPVEGAININSAAGIKRVNTAEIDAYGGAGSLWDSIKGRLGKLSAGAPIPLDVLNDMQQVHEALAGNAAKIYQRDLTRINRDYGAAFEPESTATPAAPSGQWKVIK